MPVTKEKARLETEPITDANRGNALDGPDISEEEHEVTLTEERPVVAKETVPVERVKLTKDTEHRGAGLREGSQGAGRCRRRRRLTKGQRTSGRR